MAQDLENVIRLIESLSAEVGSLSAEVHAGFTDMRGQFTDLKARFDRQEARLQRHGGLLQGGARATTRMIEWSERADDLWAARDEKLRQLEERVKRLEDNHAA